jgi:hypothetical protein
VREHDMLREIGDEPFQRVADILADLANDSSARHPRQRVERGKGAIAVGIGDLAGLQGAIIEPCADNVGQRIARLDRQQIVCVVADMRDISERVAEAQRQEEMAPRIGEFGCRHAAESDRIRPDRPSHLTQFRA